MGNTINGVDVSSISVPSDLLCTSCRRKAGPARESKAGAGCLAAERENLHLAAASQAVPAAAAALQAPREAGPDVPKLIDNGVHSHGFRQLEEERRAVEQTDDKARATPLPAAEEKPETEQAAEKDEVIPEHKQIAIMPVAASEETYEPIAPEPKDCSGELSSAVAEDCAEQLLAGLLDIERQCLHGGASGSTAGETPEVRTLFDHGSSRAWVAWTPSGSRVTGCMWHRLPGARCEDVVRAISDVEERLRWDAEAFIEFKVLRHAKEGDPTCRDVLYCAMKAPWPFPDREVLQNRWQLKLPDNEPGQAVIMQSFEDPDFLPMSTTRVRAFTHRSGYIMRPFQTDNGLEGTEVTAISESSLGGSLPVWSQNLLVKLGTRRSKSWAQRLLNHCKSCSRWT